MDGLGANPGFQSGRRAGNNMRHGMADSAMNSQSYFSSVNEAKRLITLLTAYNVRNFVNG